MGSEGLTVEKQKAGNHRKEANCLLDVVEKAGCVGKD